ncbi:Phosphatidylglycerophosphate phosphatase PTPMT1-like protein [Drosera capensis]
MHIEELGGGGDSIKGGEKGCGDDVVDGEMTVAVWDGKKVLVGAGARLLFYPTLLYNVLRNKFQAEFRWWDRVDPFVLLGAVPFPSDVPRLKELGVSGVVTLNESYETLVPTSMYFDHGIGHLVIPTRDYLFAPSCSDICLAVDFIHKNASCGHTTYVHCKAGRGRSTTVVLCYLVQHKGMTPDVAYSYVKSIRPRVLLASSQWQAVVNYYHLKVKSSELGPGKFLTVTSWSSPAVENILAFDDRSSVVVTSSDLQGYDPSHDTITVEARIWSDLGVIYKVRLVGKVALRKLSWLLPRCHVQHRKHECIVMADQITAVAVY